VSHFTLVVCLDAATDLSRNAGGQSNGLTLALDLALEPFDESKEAEPRREYSTDTPDAFWWVTHAREERDHYANGTGLKPYDPDAIGWSSVSSKKTHDEQRADQLHWKKWADQLDRYAAEFDGLRWLDVIKLYEAWKRETGDGSESVFYDEERDQVYTISTYNELSKWDWWQIGGRWSGYFRTKEDIFRLLDGDDAADIITPQNLGRWNSPEHSIEKLRHLVDGGRVKHLDIEGMRAEAGGKAMGEYDLYERLLEKHGVALPWSSFYGRVEAKELTREEAREKYNAQPLVKAFHEIEEFKWEMGCTIERFSVPREEYVQRYRDRAVPGYALLTKAGEWLAPGDMGWFGMSSDTDSSYEAYTVQANAYVDGLDPDDILVMLDLHI
jgi:hypothetical protein